MLGHNDPGCVFQDQDETGVHKGGIMCPWMTTGAGTIYWCRSGVSISWNTKNLKILKINTAAGLEVSWNITVKTYELEIFTDYPTQHDWHEKTCSWILHNGSSLFPHNAIHLLIWHTYSIFNEIWNAKYLGDYPLEFWGRRWHEIVSL